MKNVTEEEYAQLVMKNRDVFYRIAYSYVKNEQEALDIVSISVYKGLKSINSLKSTDLFKTWMTRIIINTSLDSIKKNKHLIAFEDYMIVPEDKLTTDLEEEIKFDLYSTMDILTPTEKSCIILKYFEEYSYKDISEILSSPESTIKSKVQRALSKMKTYMEGGNCVDKCGKRKI